MQKLQLTAEQKQKISRLLENHRSIRSIAADLGCDFRRLQEFISKNRIAEDRRRRRLSSQELTHAIFLIQGGASLGYVASHFRKSKSAICRIAARQRIHSDGIQFQDAGPKTGGRTRHFHCPEHGHVTVWPCVACAARSRMDVDQGQRNVG